jgi:hypothetical protein
MVAVGHPIEGKPPVDRFDPTFVSWDRWGAGVTEL